MRSAVISGISPNFLELSQSQGQVAHVLLTRSPLEHPPEGGVSFDLHVLSTLLSSQGADAQELNPPGHRPQLDVQLYAGFQQLPAGGWTGDPPGPRGA